MNAIESIKLMRKYNQCPNCGNDKVGGGEGTVNIEGEVFRRTCKCGWSVTVENGKAKEVELWDTVNHPEYGQGGVLEIIGTKARVSFDELDYHITLETSELNKIEEGNNQ